MAQVFPLTGKYAIDQGADWDFVVGCLDANNNPVDLTGYVAEMQFRDPTSGQLFASLTTQNGAIGVDASNGRFLLHMPASQTAPFAWVSANYEFKATDPYGHVKSLLKGIAEVSPEVAQ